MGVPPNYLLNLKGLFLENKGNSNTIPTTTTSNTSSHDGSLCTTTTRANLRQTRRKPKHLMRKNKRVLMKRRRSTFQRDDNNGIERKVQILQRLIPSPNPESSQGLDGLFRDTASYIISLQMRVRVMQLMVNVLETSQDYE